MQWEQPEVEGINGIIQEYNITITEQETGHVSYYSTSLLYISISHLHPFYTYKCTVAAVTIGVGPITSLIIQMPEDGK